MGHVGRGRILARVLRCRRIERSVAAQNTRAPCAARRPSRREGDVRGELRARPSSGLDRHPDRGAAPVVDPRVAAASGGGSRVTTRATRVQRELHALARAMGIAVRWRDNDRGIRTCSDETLLATLQMLGLDVARPEGAGAARKRLDHARATQLLEPVAVAWDGAPPALTVRMPARGADDPFELVVAPEERAERVTRADCAV